MQASHPTGRRAVLRAAGASMAALALPMAARAATDWPSKPVNLVVPFPAGGHRCLCPPVLGPVRQERGQDPGDRQPWRRRRHPGRQLRGKLAPDGYNFFMGGTHHVIAPSMYPRLDYDLERDFVALALLASVPQVLVVNPRNVPGKTVQELLADLRKRPGKLNYASAGAGTSHHLAGELFKLQTNTFITHIPYRGAGPALQDLIAGNVDMMFDGLGSSAQHIKSGRIRALMVSGDKRNPAFPDVPCAAESGLPDYTVTTWYGLWAPKGTPQAVQAQVIDQVQRIGSAEEIKSIWARNGADYGGMNQQQFAAMVHGEIARWAQVVKASGAKLE